MLLANIVLPWYEAFAITQAPLDDLNNYISNNGLWLADKLQQINQKETNLTKKQILRNFCDTVVGHGPVSTTIADSKLVTYDPSQSMFLYITCHGFVPDTFFKDFLHDEEEGYIDPEFRSLQSLDLICEPRTGDDPNEIRQPVGCVPGCETPTMADCDFSLLFPQVLRQLNNDITNMWMGIAYGVTQVSSETTTNAELANQFGVRYLTTILCNRDGGSCLYPKTHKLLTTFLTQAKKHLKKTKIVNTDILLKNANKCSNPEAPEDMRICAFWGNIIVLAPIADLMYNEIFYYEMLMAYYKSFLVANPFIGDFELSTVRTKNLKKAAEEIDRINFESTLHIKAVATSMRMIAQTYAYFPMHIALNAYHEGAVTFRNTLARAYQPLHQLHYKLQNVQVDR